jgi:hypothetical protein
LTDVSEKAMGMTPHETVARSGVAVALLCLLLLAVPLSAQDLDPRAYASVPINSTLAIAGFSFSTGGVVTDPTLPTTKIHANVGTPSVGLARTFGLFGLTAQALAALPYSWAAATGEVDEAAARVTRSGLSDMRLRLSVLLVGAPAMRLEQFVKAARRPIIGASVSAGAPTGQYYSDRLINLGTNPLVVQTRGRPVLPAGVPMVRRRVRRDVVLYLQRGVLPRCRNQDAESARGPAGARHLRVVAEGVGGIRRDVVHRRTGPGGRSTRPATAMRTPAWEQR